MADFIIQVMPDIRFPVTDSDYPFLYLPQPFGHALRSLLPEWSVMLRHGLPAVRSRTETVRCYLLLITVDPQFIIQRDPY